MPLRRTSTAALLVLALAATLLVPGAAAADCNDGITDCDLSAEQTDATPATVRTIATVLPLRADNEGLSLGTYLSLLPAGFEFPVGPAVGVAVRSTTTPGEGLPGAATVVESTVAIRVGVDGEDGWYPLSRVVTAGAAEQQAVGVAAVAGTGTLAGGHGESGVAGSAAVVVDFVAGQGAGEDALAGFATRTAPTFGVVPVVEGDTPYRLSQAARPRVPAEDVVGPLPGALSVEGVTAVAAPVAGEVAFVLNPDLDGINAGLPAQFGAESDLADVVVVEGSAAGLSWTADVLLVSQADDLTDPNGPFPVPPPEVACNVIIAPPNAQVEGYVNDDITIPEGCRVDFTNLDPVAQHDVICKEVVNSKRLCRSAIIGVNETVPVVGVEDLPARPEPYEYFCSVHGGGVMSGTITVVGA